jgi:hypothetical protein
MLTTATMYANEDKPKLTKKLKLTQIIQNLLGLAKINADKPKSTQINLILYIYWWPEHGLMAGDLN